MCIGSEAMGVALILTCWGVVFDSEAGPCMVRRYWLMINVIPSFLDSHVLGVVCRFSLWFGDHNAGVLSSRLCRLV